MEKPKKRTLLAVGDSRTKVFSEGLDKHFIVLDSYTYGGIKMAQLIEKVDKHLPIYLPNVLVLFGITNDLTRWSISEGHRVIEKAFDREIDECVEEVKQASAKWAQQYPEMSIVWTLPDVMDLVRYNRIRTGEIFSQKVEDQWRREEWAMYMVIGEIMRAWSTWNSNPKVMQLNLRKLLRDRDSSRRLKMLIMLLPGKAIFPHTKDYYADGLLPISGIGWSELLGVKIKYDLERQKPEWNISQPSTSEEGSKLKENNSDNNFEV